MTKNFSPISNALLIAVHAVVIWAFLSLSYGWSLDQTQDFMSAVVGFESAKAGAWLIQLAPQMLLAAAAVSKLNNNRNMAIGLIVGALLVNALDAYTNVVTFQEWWPRWAAVLVESGRSPEFVSATEPVGKFMAFLVTWFEEGVSIALGSMLQLIADLMQAMGRRPPRFFRSGIVAVGGFDFRGVTKQQKQQAKQQNSRHGQQQPAGNTRQTAPAHTRQRNDRVRHAQSRQQWPQ